MTTTTTTTCMNNFKLDLFHSSSRPAASPAQSATCIIDTVCDRVQSLCPLEMKNSAILERIRYIITNFCSEESRICSSSVAELMTMYFQPNGFRADSIEKEVLSEVEVIVKAGVVYFLALRLLSTFDKINDTEEFAKDYPEFSGTDDIDDLELQYLLIYRNMMKVAIGVIEPEGHKRLLMRICSFLEGSRRSYATGGTQSPSTSRRVLIYERESGIQCSRRGARRPARPPTSRKSAPYACPCGSIIMKKQSLWSHQTSKKHIAFVRRSYGKEDCCHDMIL
jgi:hypothetical protein